MAFRVALFALLLLVMGLPSQGAGGVIETIPMPYRDGLLWVEVTTPKSTRPLRFIVDTGAEVTVLNLETARELGLKLGPTIRVSGVNSAETGHWPQKWTATMGNQALPERVLALDLSRLAKACACEIDGLIGADFFKRKMVALDYRNEQLRILPASVPVHSENMISLDVRPKGLRVKASLNGSEPKWVRFDTGCASSLQWVTKNVASLASSSRLAVGLSPIKIHETQAAVQIGHNYFPKTLVGLHQRPIFPGEQGLLGNGILSEFGTVTIDAVRGRLILGSVSK